MSAQPHKQVKAIMVSSQAAATSEEAADVLAGLSVVPGFITGYVDNKTKKAVTFHTDGHPEQALVRGQKRVELTVSVQ